MYSLIISDARFELKRQFLKRGYNIKIEQPLTLNEKIVWLKLNDRTKLHTICADKFLVREYVDSKINPSILIPLVKVTTKVSEITKNSLPDYPVIIKTNHDSGGPIIIKDKEQVNFEQLQKHLYHKLIRNYYYYSREWQYKDIKPMIVIEKLLLDDKGKVPVDYKFHCFNGEVKFIQLDEGRFEKHSRGYFDSSWNMLPFTWDNIMGGIPKIEIIPDRPIHLDLMLTYARALSKDFKYVRVDLYLVDAIIYFGELTFHHDSGLGVFRPDSYDKLFGSELFL